MWTGQESPAQKFSIGMGSKQPRIFRKFSMCSIMSSFSLVLLYKDIPKFSEREKDYKF